MLKSLYSLRDNKSNTHKDLFPASNNDEAKRLIHSAAMPPTGPTLFAQYPDDFTLYYHGEYNYTTGEINLAGVVPTKIATVRQVLVEFDKQFRDAEHTKTKPKKGGK